MKTTNDVILEYLNSSKFLIFLAFLIFIIIFRKPLGRFIENLEILELKIFRKINLKIRRRRLDSDLGRVKSDISESVYEKAIVLVEEVAAKPATEEAKQVTAEATPVEVQPPIDDIEKTMEVTEPDEFADYPNHLRTALQAQSTLHKAIAKAVEISHLEPMPGHGNNDISGQLALLKKIKVIDARIEVVLSDLSSTMNELFNNFEPGDANYLSFLYMTRALECANLIVSRALERERQINGP